MRAKYFAITMGIGFLMCFLTGCGQSAMESGSVSTAWMPGAEASVGCLRVHRTDAAQSSQGTGFLIASNLVVTCLHVVNGANSAEIIFPSGLSLPITGIVAEDAENDLAILMITPTGTEPPPLPLSSVPAQSGDKLIVHGYPVVGASQKMCGGDVTCIGPSHGMPLAIIINAPLTHGFSGGPALNGQHQVVGVAQSVERALVIEGKDIVKKRGTVVPASRITSLPTGSSRSLGEWTKARGAIASAAAEEEFGTLDAEQRDWGKAIQHFQKATQLDPNNFEAWNRLGGTLQAMGRYDQAMDAAAKALALKPQFPEALQLMGSCLLEQKRYPEAVDTFEKCLRMNPNSDKDHFLLGMTYLIDHQSEKAREQYQSLKPLNPEAAEFLLGFIQRTDAVKTTQLIQAATDGDLPAVKTLLGDGADVNEKANNDITCLMAASMNGHTEIVKLLLEKGADVNAKASDGETALMVAAMEGRTENVKLLLEKGPDVNAKRTDGVTALMMAAYQGNTEIVNLLLEKGADVNAQTGDGKTALGAAKAGGHTDIVQLLEKVTATNNTRGTKDSMEQPVSQEPNPLIDRTCRQLDSLSGNTLDIVKSAAKNGYLSKGIAVNATKSFSPYLDLPSKQMRVQDVEAIFSRYLNAVSEVHRLTTTSSKMKATDRLAVINMSLTGVSKLLSSKKLTPSQTERITQMSKETITKLLQAEVAAGNDLDTLLGSIPGTECAKLLREMGIYDSTLQSVKTNKI